MEIDLRILAVIIDFALCFITFPIVLTVIDWFLERITGVGALVVPIWILLFFLWLLTCIAIPTGVWGKTLGKLLCRITVTDYRDEPPGIWRAIGREVLKCLSIGSIFGAILTIIQIFYQGRSWYDYLCDTKVNFNPFMRLTQTQKNWRKTFK